MPPDAPILGAGIGDSVTREVARRLERKHLSFDGVLNVAAQAREQASQCAPAAAVAALAALEPEIGRAVG
jgi:hypothetical protein